MRLFWQVFAFLLLVISMMVIVEKWKEKERKTSVAPYAWGGWEKRASEWTALTTALYWEAAPYESESGLKALAWIIRNRVQSKEFPDTIRGVVIQGYNGQTGGGCQFSFVCNGAGESPREFVRLMRKMGVHMTAVEAEARWRRYSRLAAEFLRYPGCDLTGGANHYWAVTMPDPYWKSDLDPESIIKIGSHWFGWSRYLGNDVPRVPPC